LTANLEWKHLQVLFAHVYAYGAGIISVCSFFHLVKEELFTSGINTNNHWPRQLRTYVH
jgi:hypothetical protein